MSGRAAAALLVAAGLRLVAIAASDREVADVLRYRKVADHVLDVSWNPYQAPRLYPYPPLWVWAEAAAGWLAREAGWSFPILVKLPTLLAEVFIVGWLAARSRAAGWAYALHPVAVMVGAFHGQFDAIALALVLVAAGSFERGRFDRSALALAAAIALKSFPALLLPLFLMARPGARDRLRYATLALGPVAALLLPYAVHDAGALRRELFGYGGVADFGWLGLWRGLRWLSTGALARAEAARWPVAVIASKVLFLAGYGVLLAALAAGRARLRLVEAALAVFLCFLTLYGPISAQYLLWVVPLGALAAGRAFVWHGAASAIALVGFYAFLAPGVLFPSSQPAPPAAGFVWVAGTCATWLAGAVWLVTLERQPPREDTAPATL